MFRLDHWSVEGLDDLHQVSVGVLDPRDQQVVEPRLGSLDGLRAEGDEACVAYGSIVGPEDHRRGRPAGRGPSACRSALRAWSRCQPVVAHNSSRITAFAPLDADRYRIATCRVTACLCAIISPTPHARPADRHHGPGHADLRGRPSHEATKPFRGHFS